MTSYMVHGVAAVEVHFVQHNIKGMGWVEIKVRSDDGSTHDVTLFKSSKADLFDEFRAAVNAAEVAI
jgi:hypothetical protein